MMRLLYLVGLSVMVVSTPLSAAEMVRISTQGQLQPVNKEWPASSRIGEVVGVSQYTADAYLTGAAWLRRAEAFRQSTLRQKLLQDISLLPFAPDTQIALQWQLQQLKATGRVLLDFNWDLIELLPAQNRLLKDGDEFYVPHRPNELKVVGAALLQSLPFEAGKSVAAYADDIKRLPGADPSYVWVISPDTHMRKIGVAYWNEQLAYIAPGSLLYVPLNTDHEPDLEAFQQSLLSLYAAQLLP